MADTIPLKECKLDIAFLGFFIFNLVFITYFFDLEQIVIPGLRNRLGAWLMGRFLTRKAACRIMQTELHKLMPDGGVK